MTVLPYVSDAIIVCPPGTQLMCVGGWRSVIYTAVAALSLFEKLLAISVLSRAKMNLVEAIPSIIKVSIEPMVFFFSSAWYNVS